MMTSKPNALKLIMSLNRENVIIFISILIISKLNALELTTRLNLEVVTLYL